MWDKVVDIVRILLYVAATSEVASLAHLYYYAYKNAKKESPVLKTLFLFLTSFGVILFLRLITNYTIQIQKKHSETLSYLTIVALFFVVVSARNFKKESTRIDPPKLQPRIKSSKK